MSEQVPPPYSDQMFAIIEAWRRSGLSKKIFCLEQQITYHRFHYWHQRYRRFNTPVGNDGPAFIPLELPSATASFELIYPDGRRLLFHQGVDAAYLKALLA